MKKILIAAAAATVFFASCKKDKTTTASDTWVIGGTSYSGTVTNSGGLLSAISTSPVGTFSVSFFSSTLPTTGGTYHIVSQGNATDSTDIIVTASTAAGATYMSTGSDNQTATVTVSNSKVTVTIPSVRVLNVASATDSTTASGVLVQP